MPNFTRIHEELQQHKHTTRQLLWEEYRVAHPEGYGYSQLNQLMLYSQPHSTRGPSGDAYLQLEAILGTTRGSFECTRCRSGLKFNLLSLKIPKLRTLPFETAIIERYRRRESSVEEALVEMYLAGVSVRRVEDITEALWGTRVSPSTVSELNQKIYAQIETWRNRPI